MPDDEEQAARAEDERDPDRLPVEERGGRVGENARLDVDPIGDRADERAEDEERDELHDTIHARPECPGE